MGYKEGTVLGKSSQGQSKLLDDYKKDEKPAVQENASQPEASYSDFAQRQMVQSIYPRIVLHLISFPYWYHREMGQISKVLLSFSSF